MEWLIESLRQHPEMALFLVLALGYGAGNLRFGSFKLGSVLGVLIAGIAVGQFAISVSEALKNAFFMLFLFAVGYQTGPQVLSSLRSSGVHQIILTFVICGTSIILSLMVGRLLGFDAGETSGLFAGAMTASAAFGSASGEIAQMDIPEEQRQLLLGGGAVAFAVCYMIGVMSVTWLLTKIGPRLMRVDLAQSCHELEQEMGMPKEESAASPAKARFVTRAYEVTEQLDGKPVVELESGFSDYRVFAERLRHNGEIITPTGSDLLSAGDHVILWGKRGAFVGAKHKLSGHEVDDDELLDIEIIPLDVVVTRQKAGLTLGELAENEVSRGVFLQKLVRSGSELPFTLKTPIETGDVLTVTGEKSRVDQIAEKLGYAQRPTEATDITMVSAAIFLGALIGLPALVLGGVKVSLTLFVGVLLGGIILGWLGSLYPQFGGIPQPALWLFKSLGLAGFLALVGLRAGPGFVSGLQDSGLALVASAAAVVSVTHIVGILVGRYLLRMHPGIVLGACAGAGNSAAAFGGVLETARSRIPALSYGITYALGNFIMAISGSVIVKLIGPG